TVTRDTVSPGNDVGTFRLENVPVGTTVATITFLNSRQVGDTEERETFTDTQTVTLFPPIAQGSNAGLELFVNIGQVSGRVLLPDGTPAIGANVFVAPSGLEAVTDAEGRFLIENVPAEPIEITGVLGTAAVTNTVTIGNGANNIADLRLVEDPNPNPPGLPPTISGVVRLETATGARAAGATIILLRDGSQIEQTAANAQGEFSFFVPAGNYSVQVLFDGYIDGSRDFVVNTPNQPRDASVILQRRL
ncbi:MAG: carboxypeptidase regulatory-like domain-containing protein, partial [Akkermansiaceae bacterium]|nr:carboxypeptidase regulatory-like domain-containing protein [Armatimonadota bacterium]